MLSPAHFGHVSIFNEILSTQFNEIAFICVDACLPDVRARRCSWRGNTFIRLALQLESMQRKFDSYMGKDEEGVNGLTADALEGSVPRYLKDVNNSFGSRQGGFPSPDSSLPVAQPMSSSSSSMEDNDDISTDSEDSYFEETINVSPPPIPLEAGAKLNDISALKHFGSHTEGNKRRNVTFPSSTPRDVKYPGFDRVEPDVYEGGTGRIVLNEVTVRSFLRAAIKKRRGPDPKEICLGIPPNVQR